MKKHLLLIVMILIGTSTWAEKNPCPFTIPEMTSWEGSTGTTELSGRIIVRSKQLRPIALQLVEDYKTLCQQQMRVVSGKPQKGDIVLSLKKLDTTPSEGYRLKIGDIVEIDAPAEIGAFWGTQTLLQLLEQGQLPRGEALDIPQYRLRGFMIDVGRKFVPIYYLRSLVRFMAYYKMNVLQIHLNDRGEARYIERDWDKTPGTFRLESET